MTQFRLVVVAGFILLLMPHWGNAQFFLDAQIRPRFEYRHGFQSLFPDQADPAAFISQRTRLALRYNEDKLKLKLSLQDIRVWGDVPQLNATDRNGFSLHEAWARYKLDSGWAIKAGRQEIDYDDARILGDVDWAQQARSHDAFLVQVDKNGYRADLGFAYNQNAESSLGNTLTVPRTYKAMQYLWGHKSWNRFSASLLFLNNGLQYIDSLDPGLDATRYSQTMGTHLKYKREKFWLSGNAYYQMGKDVSGNRLNAYLFGLESNINATKKISLGLGAELISGNDWGTPAGGNNRAFNPLYGTNHKFNGLMDYFYVGNHLDNVGLLDLHAKAALKLKPTMDLKLAFHNFSAPADYANRNFGNEIDLVYSYDLHDWLRLQAGYSHLFQATGMEILKGNSDNNVNNWAWVMLDVKPNVFSGKRN